MYAELEMEVEAEVEPEWEVVVDHEDYEICRLFPPQIRKIETGKIIKECEQHGYVICSLNGQNYKKYRLIALQFIANPEDLPYIDHKNKIRNDNRIENLRFVANSENQLNCKSKKGFEYEYYENLPVPCQPFVFI
jgi:hypothetical protein